MNIEQYLKNLKIDFQKTEPSEKFLSQGWQGLEEKINRLERPRSSWFHPYLRPLAFTVLLIFVFAGSFAGLAQASQRSLPGEPLYPVKRLSEDIISTATGNSIVKIDNRAKEIMGLSKKGREDTKHLEQTVKEYKEEVFETSRSGKNVKEFEEILEEHERQFEEIRENRSGSDSGREIDEAIEISKSGRGGDGDRQEEEDRSGSDSGKD